MNGKLRFVNKNKLAKIKLTNKEREYIKLKNNNDDVLIVVEAFNMGMDRALMKMSYALDKFDWKDNQGAWTNNLSKVGNEKILNMFNFDDSDEEERTVHNTNFFVLKLMNLNEKERKEIVQNILDSNDMYEGDISVIQTENKEKQAKLADIIDMSKR